MVFIESPLGLRFCWLKDGQAWRRGMRLPGHLGGKQHRLTCLSYIVPLTPLGHLQT